MDEFFRPIVRALMLTIACVSGVGSHPVWGQEPAEQFLNALRERGYFDLANDYLDLATENPLINDAFRSRIPIERAENLIQSIGRTRNINTWIERLAEAEAILEDFSKNAPTESLRGATIESLANLRYSQARAFLLQSESDRMTQAEKEQKFALARQAFNESVKSFDSARERLRSEIEAMTNEVKTKPELVPELNRLQDRYTQIRLRSPMVREYLADTYPMGDAQRKQLLEQAVREYEELWSKYSNWTAGLDACLYAARCHNKLDNPGAALPLLNELLELPDNPAFRLIRQQAAITAIDSWERTTPYPFEQVIFHLAPMTSNLTTAEQREENWGTIQLGLAKAYRAQALDMQNNNTGTAGDIGRANKLASLMARRAARSSGAVQSAAREVLAEWNIPINDTDDGESQEISTFTDAKAKALDQLVNVEEFYTQLVEKQATLKSADETERPQLETELKQIQEATKEAAGKVLETLQLALRLRGTDVEAADVNHVRYLQAYAYFVQNRYFEVAVLGQFALDRLSGIEWSRQSSGLALKALAGLYDQAAAADREFEERQLMEFAERVMERWPGTPEANQAAGTLARLAIARNDVEAAKRYSAEMSNTSSGRAGIGLRLAQQQWRDYKLAKKKLSADQLAVQADTLKEEAGRIISALEEGLKDVDPDRIDYEAAYSALLLVNAYLEVGDSEQAVAQLETASVAPLDLVKQKHPSVMDSSNSALFLKETYRSAVSAYLASMKSGNEPQVWITRTQGVLQALRDQLQQTSADSAAAEMTAIYGLVASELREQFAGISDPNQKANLANNLALFLESMAKDSPDVDVLSWVGQTLLETAEALRENGSSTGPSQKIYRQAVSALDRAESANLETLPNAELMKLKLGRLKALALAGAGDYEAAVDEMGKILSQRNALELQMDAARILQEWGREAKRRQAFEQAMMGGGPQITDPRTKRPVNSIWGWRKLVLATRGQENFIDAFHESNLNLMECQLEYGLLTNSEKAIEAAKTEMQRTRARYTDLGGANFKSRYERLEKRLQQQTP